MSQILTSLQNPQVKLAVSLQQRKRRTETGLFVLEGVRLAEELVAAGWLLECGFFTTEAAEQPRSGALIRQLSQLGPMQLVSPAVFNKLTETDNPQGIVVVARQQLSTLPTLIKREQPLLMVLDCVQDPGNMGALIRVADAAGVDGVIILAGSVDVFSGKVLRASMGSVFHLPLVTAVSRRELLSQFELQGIRMLTTALTGAVVYDQANLCGAVALVFGNEANGIDPELLAAAGESVFIPIYGKAESLNVAAAGAVIVYEAVRQRAGRQ